MRGIKPRKHEIQKIHMKNVFFSLLIVLSTLAKAQPPILKIDQITIVSTNVKQMADFYSNVLGVQFSKTDGQGTVCYSGNMGDLKLIICTNPVTGYMTNQNRHQFDFVVGNISPIVTNSIKYGGKIKGDVMITAKQKSAIISDPDGNTIVFKQVLSSEPIGKL